MAKLIIILIVAVGIWALKKTSVKGTAVENGSESQRSEAIKAYYEAHPDKDPQRKQRAAAAVQAAAKRSAEKRAASERALRAFEDRSSDWLAHQVAEERARKAEVSEMLDLKASHEARCDAAALAKDSR